MDYTKSLIRTRNQGKWLTAKLVRFKIDKNSLFQAFFKIVFRLRTVFRMAPSEKQIYYVIHYSVFENQGYSSFNIENGKKYDNQNCSGCD